MNRFSQYVPTNQVISPHKKYLILTKLLLVFLTLYASATIAAPGLYCSLSSNKPWLRQQVLLLCEFYTERSFMEIEHNDLKVPWALSYKIPLQQSGVRRHGKQAYFHRFGWVLIPLKSGARSLKIPKLKLDFGKVKIAFPVYKFTVKALPVYLNPDSLVGKINIKLLSEPKFWLQHQHLYRFKFRVTAQGVPAQWMPAVEFWLRSRPYARYYVQRVDTRTHIDHLGLVTYLTIDAAVVPSMTGQYSVLKANVQYFDPLQSQWNNYEVEEGAWFSVPGWLYWIVTLFIALVVIYGVWRIGKYSAGFLVLWQRQKHVRTKIKKARQYSDLRPLLYKILDNYGVSNRVPENTLYNFWQSLYGPNKCLQDILDINSRQEFTAPDMRPDLEFIEYKKQVLGLTNIILLSLCYHKKNS